MNLSQTLSFFFGGPGSGCAPEVAEEQGNKCGRPSLADNAAKYNAATKKWETHDGKILPEHIAKIRIPPAWKNVTYNPDPDADLLVRGNDIKGRVQAIYSQRFVKENADAKFARISELDTKFRKISQEVAQDVASGIEEAHVLRLIMATGIRPGSDTDTGGERKAYGATTLKGSHVHKVGDRNDQVRLKFVGKKGVEISIKVTNPDVARDLLERKAVAGSYGRLFDTSAAKLLDYTSSKDGGSFKTKDFRTLLATRIATQKVTSMKKPKTDKEYKKSVREVAKVVANQLGNTPTVSLQSYINPVVFAQWRQI